MLGVAPGPGSKLLGTNGGVLSAAGQEPGITTPGLGELTTRAVTYFQTSGLQSLYTLTTNFRYRRLGDLNREPATLCACAGGEQQTIIKIVIHFL